MEGGTHSLIVFLEDFAKESLILSNDNSNTVPLVGSRFDVFARPGTILRCEDSIIGNYQDRFLGKISKKMEKVQKMASKRAARSAALC